VQASITWSYDLCSPAGRLLWTRLSVFSGGFSLAAAEAVCGGGDLPAADVLETLIGLVDQSIVLRADVTDSTDPDPDATDADENGLGTGRGSTRYRLLEVVREQGADRADAADATACGARHRDYYRGVARGFAASFGASFDGSGQAGRISRLAPDAANLRLALERSLASGPHVAGQRDAGQPAVEQDILRCALAALAAQAAQDRDRDQDQNQAEPDPSAPAALAGTAPARPASGSEPEVTGATDRWVLLTAREREVAALVATGLTNKSIAMRLFVSKRTIDAHVEHILAKLRCASRVQIAAFVAHGRVVGEESETGMEASRIPDPRESQEHVSAPPGVSGTSVG